MKKKVYLRPCIEIINFVAGESVCIATGSGGTGEALSKGDNMFSPDEDDNENDNSSIHKK
jgi:hypothetical protein